MNILELCKSVNKKTNLSELLDYMDYKIINKVSLDNISLVSYDAYIITIDFLDTLDKNKELLQKIESQKKPIIYVYNSSNKPEDIGMKFLSEKYKLKFNLTDCSVLDTPNWNYMPEYHPNDQEAYSMIASGGNGNCYVKNTKNFYIFKKNNIIVMHDLFIKKYKSGQIEKSRMPNMVKYILQTNEEEGNINVDWLNNIKILDDEELEILLEKNKQKFSKIIGEQNEINNKIEKNNYYKCLLYCSGDKLVEVVESILEEMVKVKIDDKDLKKQDLYLKLDGKNILIEVKGVNHPFQRDNISQVKRHVKDYAEEHEIYGADVEKKCKGVLILNPYSLHDLKDKISKEFYSKEVIVDAEYEKVCTLDTLTLLNYYSKWRKNPESINLKNIILNTNYNKPDYNDIINL